MKTTNGSNPEDELIELATRISGYQKQRRWSDAATLKALPLLGSTKTYKRILAKDCSELDLDKQLLNYQRAWEQVKALTGDTDPEELLFEDVHGTAMLSEAFLDVMETTSIARVIILQGPTSSGKSAARRVLMRQHPNRLILVEATVGWQDRPGTLLGSALEALGRVNIPQGCDARFALLVAALRESRKGLVIEEAQHLGPKSLNMVKSLINSTPGEVILVTIDTLWRRLETAAYEECRQISSNRLHRRINLGSEVREEDARVILVRRLGISQDDAADAAARLIPLCRTNGRLAFLRGVCTKALEMANGHPVTAEVIGLAITSELRSRGGN